MRGYNLLVLNPDVWIRPETLERLVKTMQERSDAAMAGCLIRTPDGRKQVGCRRAVSTPWRSLVRMLHYIGSFRITRASAILSLMREPLPRKRFAVEAISGAFMLIRREIFEQIGTFDDAYFLHCKNLNWCMRVRQAGWQILFVPGGKIVN